MFYQIFNDCVLAGTTGVVGGGLEVAVPFVWAGLNTEARAGVCLEHKQSALVVENVPRLVLKFRGTRRERDCQRDGLHGGLRAAAQLRRPLRAVYLLELHDVARLLGTN